MINIKVLFFSIKDNGLDFSNLFSNFGQLLLHTPYCTLIAIFVVLTLVQISEISPGHKSVKYKRSEFNKGYQDFGAYQYSEYPSKKGEKKRFLITVNTQMRRLEDLQYTSILLQKVYIDHPVYKKKLSHHLTLSAEYNYITFNGQASPIQITQIGERPMYSISCIKGNVEFFFNISLRAFCVYHINNHHRYYHLRRAYIVLELI